jgi:Spy/CpxP family protein refolding chaperone
MPQKVLLCFLGLIMAVMAWAPCSWAQPAGHFGEGFQDRLMEIKRSQLGPALGVDQRTVDQLLQIDQRYKPQKHQLIMDMKNDLRRLEQVMNQPHPPEQEVKAILSTMKRKRQEMLNLQQRKDEEEMALLTPVQQGRYLLYLMSLVKQARNVKSGPERARPLTPQMPREIPVFRPTR